MRALPARRGAAWIAAGTAATAAIVVGVVGVVGSAPPAVSQRPGTMTLAEVSAGPVTAAYACKFPAGSYRVGARVTASYPATAVTGHAVRPVALSLAVTVPAAALASAGTPVATIAVSARLAISGVRANTVWASVAASPAPLTVAGQDLVSGPLRPSAPPPALTATLAGPMTVTAGSLALLFTPAGKSPDSAPPALAATCTLEPGQHAALATIAVARGTAKANPAAIAVPCPALPKAGLKLNPSFPLPRVPRGAIVFHQAAPDPGCAYLTGLSDVRKAYGAAQIGPALVSVDIGRRVVHTANYFEEDSAGQLDYQFRACRTCPIERGLPPARATFLDFGIVPVSATLQLTEVGTVNLIGQGTGFTLTVNTAWSLMELSISDVTVNGKFLNVGDHCRTKTPVLIKLAGLGSGGQAYSLQQGGGLAGNVTIPEFTGCGVTENLDDLITGTVSGPGNYAVFTQAPLCTVLDGQGCPPQKRRPLR